VAEWEERGSESSWWQEAARRSGRGGRDLREQAELAWSRVHRAMQGHRARPFSPATLLERLERIPPASYMAGIATSFLISAMLLALGRRRSSTAVGLAGPLLLGSALLLSLARRTRRI